MQNLLECEAIEFDIEGKPLLRRSLVIKEAKLTGVQWNTPRTTSGALSDTGSETNGEPSWADRLRDKLTAKIQNHSQNWLNGLVEQVQDQLDPELLESVRVAKERRAAWDDRFADLEDRANQIQTRIDEIKAGSNAGDNALEKIESYQRTAQEVKRLMAELQQIRNELKQMPQLAQADLQDIDDARLRDQQRVKEIANLTKLDRRQITESLLGPELADRLREAVNWINYVQSYADNLSERPEPERTWGWDIVFSQEDPTPKFLIKKALISGNTQLGEDQFRFSGSITGITSQPLIYGQLLKVDLVGDGDLKAHFRFQRDQAEQQPTNNVDLFCDIPHPLQLQLGRSSKLSIVAEAPKTVFRLQLALKDKQLDGRMAVQQPGVRITSRSTDIGQPIEPNGLHQALQTALGNVNQLQADVHLAGTIDSPEWQLESNLGTELADGLNNVIAQQFTAQRDKLREKIDLAAQAQTTKFREQIGQRYGTLTSQLDLNENQAQKLIQRVAGGKSLKLNNLIRRF